MKLHDLTHRMGQSLSSLLFASTAWLVQRLPLRAVRGLARFLGSLFYFVIPIRRTLTQAQLRFAFPDASEARIRGIARESYCSLATAILEMMWIPRLTPDILETQMEIDRPDLVEDIRVRGQGAVLMTGHYGNWEWTVQRWRLAFGSPIMAIVHPLHNPGVNQLVEKWRTMFGNRMSPMRVAARASFTTLREHGYVAILADQSASKEALFLPFFGRLAATFEGPAKFALREKAPILFFMPVRRSDGSYILRTEEIPTADLDGDTPENCLELTRRHTAALEAQVRENPEFWLWQHRRWKHAPPVSNIKNDPAASS